MKLLHYIPDLKAASHSYHQCYMLDIISGMVGRAEVHVITSAAGGVHLDGVSVHACPSRGILFWLGRRKLRKLLSSLRPDVVHIHSCWDFRAAVIFNECLNMRIPTVLTPWRSLEPWHFSHHYLLSKLPRYVLFQRKMIMRAVALHAVCAQEAADLQALGFRPRHKAKHSLNDRIYTSEIFLSQGGADAARVAGSLLQLYRKVSDSEPFPMMTKDDCLAEDWLMMAGAVKGRLDVAVPRDILLLVQGLDAVSWRKIMLHSADQGVLDYVMDGISVVGLSVPKLEVAKVDRFVLHTRGSRGAVERKVARLVGKFNATDGLQPVEAGICGMMASLIVKARYGVVLRSDFVDAYMALRFTSYDEAAVETALRKAGLEREAAGILHVMEERYGLGEGFMFIEPQDGKASRKFKAKLNKSCIQ